MSGASGPESAGTTRATGLSFVEDVEGRPRIRWKVVGLFAGLIAATQVAAALAVSAFSGVPVRFGPVVVLALGPAAGLIVAIELQRQRVLLGRWRFRFSLGAVMLLTVVAALMFAAIGNDARWAAAGGEVNRGLQKRLEAIIGPGSVGIGQLHGRRIACIVNRTDFDDADLAELIEATRHPDDGRCELVTLFVSGTAVTAQGMGQLAACERLEVLSATPGQLTGEVAAMLGKRTRLRTLYVDYAKLSGEQRRTLREALPDVEVNGQSWRALERLYGGR